MAGKLQRYVPKFVQRQFLARNHPLAKGECVWRHFRGNLAKPLETSLIGAEEYFYSHGAPTAYLRDTISLRAALADPVNSVSGHTGAVACIVACLVRRPMLPFNLFECPTA